MTGRKYPIPCHLCAEGECLEDIRLALGLAGNMNRPTMEFIGRNDVSAYLRASIQQCVAAAGPALSS